MVNLIWKEVIFEFLIVVIGVVMFDILWVKIFSVLMDGWVWMVIELSFVVNILVLMVSSYLFKLLDC